MALGIAEDFTNETVFDKELTSMPLSGLYINSGVHPSININNLLHFLPNIVTITAVWNNSVTYEKFETSRNKRDLVVYNSKIYQSIKSTNLNKEPGVETTFWLETNIESIRIKNLIFQVLDRVYSDLNLTKRLVNNQFIYEVGDESLTLPNDYAAWVFEPKGSDYITLRINQISFQKTGTTPVNLYVINQGVLIDTLTITPSNGVVDFKDLDYSFSGKGEWIFAIDSTDVIVKNYTVDPYKYEGFICYTANGTGDEPESADYNYGTFGNGLGFNITAILDSNVYIKNNINEFANFVRACFEYMVFQVFLNNPNNRNNREQRLQMNDKILMAEIKQKDADTVCSRYYSEKKKAIKQLQKTFDTQLDNNDDCFEFEVSSV